MIVFPWSGHRHNCVECCESGNQGIGAQHMTGQGRIVRLVLVSAVLWPVAWSHATAEPAARPSGAERPATAQATAAAQPGATAQSLAAVPASACDRPAFRVVVDVGHTAQVPGAFSARGVPEFDFNLRLAKEVERALLDAGFARTALLVTEGRSRPGLFGRVERANDVTADLFLSIHHDSVPGKFKETWEYEGKEHQYCDRFSGHSIFVSNDNVNRQASLQFGRLLGLELKARELKYTPHYTEAFMGKFRRVLVDAEAGVYRYDQLIVLRKTHMPAVLLEAGSIVNREEELLVGTPDRQALISAAVTDAVDKFCASRSARLADRTRARVSPVKQAARPAAVPQQATSVKRH
jgi:N-acetylmuramoyl-L-alanine amidase